MSKNRMINTRFWSDSFIVDHCNMADRLLFLYLLTNERTNIIGVYEMPARVAAFETGIDKDDVIKMLTRLSPKVEYKDGWVYIRRFVDHQASNPSIDRGMANEVAALPAAVREWVSAVGINSMRLAQAFDSLLQAPDSLSESVATEVISKGAALYAATPAPTQAPDSLSQAVPKTRVIKSNLIKLNSSNSSAAGEPLAHIQMRKDIQEVFEFYIKSFKAENSHIKLSDQRKAKLKARIQDAGKEMLFKAITNTAASAFHRGDNDRGWKANIDFIIRSYEQVEKLSTMDELETSEAANPGASKVTQDDLKRLMGKL
jgi:hypothetical protein